MKKNITYKLDGFIQYKLIIRLNLFLNILYLFIRYTDIIEIKVENTSYNIVNKIQILNFK